MTPDEPAALLLAPESPYPMRGGGALRTASLLHHLARHYAVDLIVFRQPGAPDPTREIPRGLIRRMWVLDLPANRRHLPARALRNAARAVRRVPPLVDRFGGFRSQIGSVLEGKRYQVGVVEHSWCAPYGDLLATACDRTVLDLHNLESLLHERCAATESAAARWLHGRFALASREIEQLWLPRYSQVLVTSAADKEAVQALAPGARLCVYPNALAAAAPPLREESETIVFSGNMEYHPNRTAVRFFRRQVWPELREQWPSLIWRLVGKNPESIRALAAGDPRIEIAGPVEDAVFELARARVAVVPLLAGSGTRLKILEAWAARTPVVSTSIGAEGLPVSNGEHLLLADTASEFTAATSRLLQCSTLRTALGDAGRSLLEKEFTWETAWKSLDF